MNRLTCLAGPVVAGVALATAVTGQSNCIPNLPPLPAGGQTVIWSAAESPYLFCEGATIPAGGTVVVEPGVTVDLDDGATLDVRGTLLAQGSPAEPVTFNAFSDGFTAGRIATFGTTELRETEVNCPLTYPAGGATILLEDSVIRADLYGALGFAPNASYAWKVPPTIIVERCQVIGSGAGSYDFFLDHCHGLVRDVTIDGATAFLDGYLVLDRVNVNSAPQAGIDLGQHVQNVYLNDLTVTNATDAAIAMSSANGAWLGPDNLLQGCLYPVQANNLLPGSVIPSSGNANNAILADGKGHTGTNTTLHWPELGVPWAWNAPNYAIGKLIIDPGVTVLMHPDMLMIEGTRLQAEGRPAEPILFTRQDPSRSWLTIRSASSVGTRYEHCIFEGASFLGTAETDGAVSAFNALVNVDSSVFRNNYRAIKVFSPGWIQLRDTRLQASQELDLFVGSSSGVAWLSSPDAPNGFDPVGTAISFAAPFVGLVDARHCWWGAPSGPAAPQNPGGQGASIVGGGASQVQIFPFLRAPPDLTNHPPIVRLSNETRAFYAPTVETGDRLVLEWTVEDDDQIAEQRIQFSEDANFDGLYSDLAVLPPGQRSYAMAVPDVPLIFGSSWVRVVATDSLGQQGRDEMPLDIPSGDLSASTEITSSYAGKTFRGGEDLPPITYTPIPTTTLGAVFSILLEADEASVPLGGSGVTSGSWSFTELPFVSTDTARVCMLVWQNGNDTEHFYSQYFAIRPDARLGDAAPVVKLVSPTWETFALGSTVSIEWTASDDEALSGFKLQASYDEGRSWHVIARDLPADARDYQWALPPGGGTLRARVRVIAYDLRLQSSSSTWSNAVPTEPRKPYPGVQALGPPPPGGP